MAFREVLSTPFPERVNRSLKMTWEAPDATGTLVPIPLTDVTVLTWTLYVNDVAKTIINSRTDTNVLNTGPGTYHATTGLLTIALSDLDMAIVGTEGPSAEIHVSLVEMTYGGGKFARQEVVFTVVNLDRVP